MYEVHSLSDEQLAGQRLMVGFKGKVLDDDLRFVIREMHVGGLILFKRNVSDPSQVAELCQSAKAYAVESGNPPLMIAIGRQGVWYNNGTGTQRRGNYHESCASTRRGSPGAQFRYG